MTRGLVVTIGGLYLTWHMVATIAGSDLVRWKTWIVTGLVGAVCLSTLLLVRRRLLSAQLLLQGGLLLALTSAVYLFRWPYLTILYPLLPLLAIVSVGWWGGLLLEGLVIVATLWLLYGAPAILPSAAYALLLSLAGVVTLVVGWASSRSLFTVIQWTVAGYSQAQRNMEEARQHRAQLTQLLKDLDKAYYQLERANAALTAARRAAEDAEQFKTEFVTNVSHELRTPLNLIVGFTEMMMLSPESYSDIPLPGPYRSDLETVYHSAQHMLALVDDVLDLARIEVGRIALTREEVHLDTLVHETVAIVHDYIVAKGLDLRIHLSETVEPVWVDRLRIRQVLLNLLVNAARHTTRGWIAIDITSADDEILISVADTGTGISAQDLPQVFQEFRTTEQPFSEWHSGTGLGLPISKKYVELHHGRMGVESVQGVGTRFWFTLPCMPFDMARLPLGHERYYPLVRLGASERIVVVVHPEPGTVALFRRHLDGYRVIGASLIEQGIALANEMHALAILTDQTLPAGRIPDHLLWVRFALPSSGMVARQLGAQHLLVKPVARRELLAAIDQLQVPTRRILIVDDDPEVVRLFHRMLHSQLRDCRCVEAYNGAEALKRMHEERPDLVLLDLVMPEVDGQTVLAAMANDPALADIPVILVSARGQDQANLRVTDAIQIERPHGFELGELIQTLASTLNALAPGWVGLDSHASAHPEAPVG
ncbi:MAG: hybrid sensor histidine kinase/response regulator [Caldilineaceae bacterium]|nr:hybrid sensor histidine kinase/response regulator [Caldilineaceae bacterium]